MVEAPSPCTHCGSSEVAWKSKARLWECLTCEARFETTSPEPVRLSSIAANPKVVFFSYGHDANQPLVAAFRSDLEKRGHRVWIDYKQIGTWQDWRGRITAGVHESDLAVAFLSKHSTRDPGVCRNELAMALNRFGMVYPILLEPVKDVTPPVTISNLQWQDLSQWRDIRDGRVPRTEWGRWYEERLLELVHLIEGEATEFTGDIQALRELLRPVSFTSDIARHVPDFVGRDWVFEAYERWLTQQPDSRLLWIKGGPGLGKSAIAAMLVHSHQSAIVGAWFCQGRSLERGNARVALCSLAFQLACRWDDYRSKLLFQLQGPGDKFRDLNEADLFHLLFTEPLTGLIWREQRLIIVIDALDEAVDAQGRNMLLNLLVTQLAALPPWLAFVVTSRPDPAVVAQLEGFSPFEFNAHEPRNREDLQAYLETALGRRADFQSLPLSEKERTVRTLVDNSEGMILYLREVVRALEEGVLTLERAGAMPGGLRSLYCAAFDHLYGGEREAGFAKRVRPLLRLVVAAPGALPSELARAVLGWDRETWLIVRNVLGSYIVEDGTGIRLFHKTLQEWLTDEKSGPYWADADAGTEALGEFLVRCCVSAEHTKEMRFKPEVRRWLPELAPELPLWNEPEALLVLGEKLGKLTARADEFLTRAIDLVEAADHPNVELLSNVLCALVGLSQYQGEYGKATEFAERLLAVQEAALDGDHPEFAMVNARLANLINSGPSPDLPRVEALLRRALAITREANGADEGVYTLLYELGMVLFQQGKLDSAEEVGLAMQVLDENGRLSRLGPILHEELFIYIKYRREKIARGWETSLDRIASLERQHGPDDASVEEAVIALAEKSEPPLARELYGKALAIRERRFGSESVEVALLLERLSGFAEPAEAYELQARAVAMYEKTLGGEDDGNLHRLLFGLAALAMPAGKPDIARETVQRFVQNAEISEYKHRLVDVLKTPPELNFKTEVTWTVP